jgi:hypothetical protein
VSGEAVEEIYLARIAELEAEVLSLRAQLAAQPVQIPSGGPRYEVEPPIAVTADGTQGIRRGVSQRGPRSRRGNRASRDEET